MGSVMWKNVMSENLVMAGGTKKRPWEGYIAWSHREQNQLVACESVAFGGVTQKMCRPAIDWLMRSAF
jgi:hypothetical protein